MILSCRRRAWTAQLLPMDNTGWLPFFDMKQIACCVLAAVLSAACGNDAPASTPTTPTTIAPPSVTEVWEATLAVGATRFYSYTVPQNGTVNITLALLTENGEDAATQVTIGAGFPAATGCSTASTAAYSASETPAISATQAPGVYCVKVTDAGTLTVPIAFRILIARP